MHCTSPRGGLLPSLGGGDESPGATAGALAWLLRSADAKSPVVKCWLRYCQATIPLDPRNVARGDGAAFTHYYMAQAVRSLGDGGYAKLFPDAKASERLTWSRYRKTVLERLVVRQKEDGHWDGDSFGPAETTARYLIILQLDIDSPLLGHR